MSTLPDRIHQALNTARDEDLKVICRNGFVQGNVDSTVSKIRNCCTFYDTLQDKLFAG